MNGPSRLFAALVVAMLTAVGLVGCNNVGHDCAPGIDDHALPSTARLGHVSDAGTFCREDGGDGWRSWIEAPPSGTSEAQAQDHAAGAMRRVGWRDLSGVPPVATGFVSLCRPGKFATIFTEQQASRAEKAQEFANEAPLGKGQIEIDIGKSNAVCPNA